MASLFVELKRRKVFRVAAVYAVVAWLLIQVADVVLPTFGAPAWVSQTLIFFFVIGFPIALVLAWAYEVTPEGVRPDSGGRVAQAPAGQSQALMYAIFGLLLVAVGFQIGDRFIFAPPAVSNSTLLESSVNSGATTRSNINLGTIERINFRSVPVTRLDITPDGSRLAYDSFESGTYRINIRDLATLQAEVIYESELSTGFPRISPDGNHVAFHSGDGSPNLYVMPVNGGAPQLVRRGVRVTAGSLAWLDSQNLIFEEQAGPHIYSLASGQSTQLPEDQSDFGRSALFRLLDPIEGTDLVLFTVSSAVAYNTEKRIGLYDRVTGQRRLLISNGFNAQFISTGHIVFMRGDNLMAAPFDKESLELLATPRIVQSNIENYSGGYPVASFAISDAGELVYLPGSDVSLRSSIHFVWVYRDGSEERLDLPTQDYNDPVLSPDGQRLALVVDENDKRDIWVHDFSQPGILNRVTRNGGVNPLWSPDGEFLYFQRDGVLPEERGISRMAASGIGEALPVATAAPNTLIPRSFTPEGDLLAILNSGRGDNEDVLRLAVGQLSSTQERNYEPLLSDEYRTRGPHISHDGRLLAYDSDEAGFPEVFLRPYPDINANKWRVSDNGGYDPQWSAESNVLHFMDRGDNLISLEISLDPTFRILSRQEIPTGDIANRVGYPYYAVDPNGDRVLVMKRETGDADDNSVLADGQTPVLAVLVDNWLQELTRLAPAAESP